MDMTQLVMDPLRTVGASLSIFLPKAFWSIVLVTVGWLLAKVTEFLVVRVLRAIGVERLAEKGKLSEVLRRGAIRFSFVEVLGRITYWLIIAAAILVALQVVGIAAATDWLAQLGAFIPKLIICIVIFLFGMLLSSFLGATVRAASLNAGFPQGHLAGQAVSTLVLLVTVIVALEQLQVVTRTIEVALYILLATFGLAFALALGIGAHGFVKRFLEEVMWEKWKSQSK